MGGIKCSQDYLIQLYVKRALLLLCGVIGLVSVFSYDTVCYQQRVNLHVVGWDHAGFGSRVSAWACGALIGVGEAGFRLVLVLLLFANERGLLG